MIVVGSSVSMRRYRTDFASGKVRPLRQSSRSPLLRPSQLLSPPLARGGWRIAAGACLSAALSMASGGVPAQSMAPLESGQISGDGVSAPLTSAPGDAAHGRALLVARENANCILCHAIPEVRFFGNLAPALAGIGSRLSAAQLRLRVADNGRVNPNSIMPAYYRSEGLHDVAPQYRGKTILSAQEVEDVVAYLRTLK